MATEFPPTEEQASIIELVKSTKENILIQALAGAAKTSTLVLVAKALPGAPILSVAFNKRIAEEMAKRLPGHCLSATLNSIGHKAWAAQTGRKLTLVSNKTSKVLNDVTESLHWREKERIGEAWSDIMTLVARAKLYGYIPEGKFEEATRLVDRETLEAVLADFELDPIAWELLDELLTRSIAQSYAGSIDFDDQLYMSTLFNAPLPRFPTTLTDESQDFSPLNHQMIARLVGDRRLVAVGDAYQSIYGFRGALSDSMDALRRRFNMTERTLTVSFRCPKAVVKEAWSRAPMMKWGPMAIEGDVRHIRGGKFGGDAFVWGPWLFPEGSAVICRNNAPLFSLGLKLLRAGRLCKIMGMDISKKLIKILREFGDTNMPQIELLAHLDRWRAAKIAEGKLSEEGVEDRYACLCVFAQSAPSLGGAIAAAEKLFASTGSIELLSGHKSKGLEWDSVFYLDPWRIPSKYAVGPEEKEQEANLDYVIKTRSKNQLTYIDLDDFDIDLREPFHKLEQ